MGYPMRLKLISNGLTILQAKHYTTLDSQIMLQISVPRTPLELSND